jgi:DNA-binding NarL/FixJ family response regulator
VIRVLVADDQALVRGGFRLILDAQPDIEVVGEAADGVEALERTRALQPDVVLMDIRMPALDGLEATRRLLADTDPPRVLMLTTFDLDEYVYDALRAGASGFLLKDVRPEELADAVRVVAAGDTLLAPLITRRLVEQYLRRPRPGTDTPAPLDSLTDRFVSPFLCKSISIDQIDQPVGSADVIHRHFYGCQPRAIRRRGRTGRPWRRTARPGNRSIIIAQRQCTSEQRAVVNAGD